MNDTIINTSSDFIPEQAQVNNLAAALFVACQIQHGHHLALLLGNGDETCNQEAVKTWVSNNLSIHVGKNIKATFDDLFYQLLTELDSWEPLI